MSRANPFDTYAITLNWARSRKLRVWSADEVDSTNRVAKNDLEAATRPQLADAPAQVTHPSLYLAEAQTQGRGRGSNTWITSQGALLSSWAFALSTLPRPLLAPLAGLALFEAARATWPQVAFNLKAPNDLYIGDKKTAGLLIETVNHGSEIRTVIGLGLNVSDCPTELETATCLANALGTELTCEKWEAFLTSWVQKLEAAVAGGLKEKLAPETCVRLKDALNLHPLLSEPILEVDGLGQLRSASRTLYWHEL